MSPPKSHAPQSIHQSITNQRLQAANISDFSGPMSLPWGGSIPSGPNNRVDFNTKQFNRVNQYADGRKGPKVSPWGTGDPVSVLAGGSGDRIKPDRSGRKIIQKFQFSTDTEGEMNDGVSQRVRSLNKVMNEGGKESDNGSRRQLASLSIADMSPRLALQRILALFERGEQREAAAFLRRLSMSTFRQIVTELPTDLFVDSLPQSLPVLEALYAKLFLAGGKKLPSSINVSPETVIWQLVKFFACQEDQSLASREGRWELCGPFINTCKRLLSVLLTAEPRLRRIVADRKRLLTKVIEGLGQHGMVGSADQSLMNLHDGLRIEFLKVKEQYQGAIQKLEELALSSKEPVTNSSGGGKAPVLSSHQRQLSLQLSQVQERLIKNKTLLTAAEPAISCTSLEVLIGILQRRIELDKEVLFQFNTIKNETKLVDLTDKNPTIAPTLMKFQRGCHQVLELMKEVTEEEDENCSSDISGYHSDSDSTVMMSGNSPFVSKTARYNFLSRSVRMGSKHSNRLSVISSEVIHEGYASSSGFSSLPPSHIDSAHSTSLTPSSPSTSSASPPESSSSHPDSDSNSSLDQEVDRKRPGRTRTKKGATNSVWNGKLPKCPNCENEGENKEKLHLEVEKLAKELSSTRQTIVRMHEREEKMKERLMDLKLRDEQISISSASSVWLSSRTVAKPSVQVSQPAQGSRREASRLVAKYGELYSQARLDTLDALDELKELSDADELKNKLLFSVVVVCMTALTLFVTKSLAPVHLSQVHPVPCPSLPTQSVPHIRPANLLLIDP